MIVLSMNKTYNHVINVDKKNWGRAQARKRKSSPMEPLKAKATNAENKDFLLKFVLW